MIDSIKMSVNHNVLSGVSNVRFLGLCSIKLWEDCFHSWAICPQEDLPSSSPCYTVEYSVSAVQAAFLIQDNRQHQFFQLSAMLSILSDEGATLLPAPRDSIKLLDYLKLDLPISEWSKVLWFKARIKDRLVAQSGQISKWLCTSCIRDWNSYQWKLTLLMQ